MDSAPPQIEPVVGVLNVVGGRRVEDASPCTAALAPPPRAARSREGERLFILLDLTGPPSPHLHRELREVMARTYWSSSGSITAALRRAASAANRYLFNANLHATPSDRHQGGLILAVLHSDDLFVLQAGPSEACFLHGARVERHAPGESVSSLGVGPLTDVHLYHVFVVPGDELLLAPYHLIRQAGDDGLARVLPRAELEAVLDGLEQVGAGTDFCAMVVRWARATEAPVGDEAPAPVPEPERKPVRRRLRARPEPAREPAQPERRARPVAVPQPPPPSRRARPKPARRPGPSLGQRLKGSVRAAGRGIAGAGAWMAGGMRALFQRMLPGPQRAPRGRARASRARGPRPAPKENRTVMMAIAIGIPVVLAIVVALVYMSFGAEARVQGFINQAREEIALAEAAGDDSTTARPHWAAALGHAQKAVQLRPDNPVATTLESQARAALDMLDGIVRVQPVRLWDFGSGTAPRRLVVHGQAAFVLDPAGGWVVKLTLDPSGAGVVEQGETPVLVRTGQEVGGGEVGNLVDCVWGSAGGERQTSSLVVLEEGGGLVSYDPAWVDEEGIPRLTRSFLGTTPGSSRAVDFFGGRLYVLDADANQIWRYDPRDDTYPGQPNRYFVTSPRRSLVDALDMAIDGNIYVLYEDGEILQYLQGEHQPGFEVHGLPDDDLEAVAIALDPDGNSGLVYVADAGNKRVVVLGSDGAFRAQLRADEPFDALETLAVDEAAKRLYVVSDGWLYVASLP